MGETSTALVEGRDYTIENGRWIFTRSYLLGRGACCGSGCRNCPYPKAKSCSSCGTSFPCNPGSYWCSSVTVSVERLAALRASFRDCLCPKCLGQANGSTSPDS